MAHFAELDENNIVKRVIVVHNNELLDENNVEQEQKGIDFCVAHYGGTWIQTSYNNNFRGIFASIGFIYEPIPDVFYELIAEFPGEDVVEEDVVEESNQFMKPQAENYLINFARNGELPWVITLTDKKKIASVKTWLASDFEINTLSKSFAGKQYYYIICKGVLSWDGTKAIINAPDKV